MLKNYKKYWMFSFNFQGRASRTEFWHSQLANLIILFIFNSLIGIANYSPVHMNKMSLVGQSLILAIFIIPNTSLYVRRFRDARIFRKLGYLFPLIGVFQITNMLIKNKAILYISIFVFLLNIIFLSLAVLPSKQNE